jgi:hypothetical protein
VGELGEGVADGVVDGALADFAALDVGDGDAQGEGDGGGREHLVAVGDEQQQVGPPGAERIGEAEVARPMVLAMPVSVSELSRHSMRATMGKPSRSISRTGVPNSGERCAPSAMTPRSTSGCRCSSRGASRDGCSRRGRW